MKIKGKVKLWRISLPELELWLELEVWLKNVTLEKNFNDYFSFI